MQNTEYEKNTAVADLRCNDTTLTLHDTTLRMMTKLL